MSRNACIRAGSVLLVSWSEFVSRVIKAEAHEKVGAKIGVSGPTVGRWINGTTGAPRVEVAVRFARAYEVSVLETFVEAGYITAEEAGAKVALSPTVDFTKLSNEALLKIVGSRMTKEGGGAHASDNPGRAAATNEPGSGPDPTLIVKKYLRQAGGVAAEAQSLLAHDGTKGALIDEATWLAALVELQRLAAEQAEADAARGEDTEPPQLGDD